MLETGKEKGDGPDFKQRGHLIQVLRGQPMKEHVIAIRGREFPAKALQSLAGNEAKAKI